MERTTTPAKILTVLKKQKTNKPYFMERIETGKEIRRPIVYTEIAEGSGNITSLAIVLSIIIEISLKIF